MRGPTHIIGGFVITGLFSSLWSINLFSNPYYITATFIGSILPDIDHTKSIIGKLFYPLAKYLQRKYGHRTVTHSFLFLFSITLITKILLNNDFALIVFFSVLSHFLLDMVTIQGIPLLYPYRRNPCVIPGKPEFRFNSKNYKAEGLIFIFFCLCFYSFQDLYKNGFWTFYNKKFNDIEHVSREFKKNKNVLSIDYDIDNYQDNFKGNLKVLFANDIELVGLSNNKIVYFKKDGINKFNKLVFKVLKEKLIYKKIEFKNISIDSLQNLVNDKFIKDYEFIFNKNVIFSSFRTEKSSMYFKDYNDFNIHIIEAEKTKENTQNTIIQDDSKDIIRKENILNQIQIKELQKSEELNRIAENRNNLSILKSDLNKYKNIVNSSTDNYEINEAQEKIIELNKEINSFALYHSNKIEILNTQINKLKKQLNHNITYFSNKKTENINIKVSGYLNYVLINKL